MLAAPHIAPLAKYVDGLRAKRPAPWEFQDFDPLDGGVNADMLFLLEKPGPMTSPNGKRQGSGFISRNNDDPTAEVLYGFMIKADIPRERVVIWNVIPGWNGTIKMTTAEWYRGTDELKNLLPLLPKVKTAVLVGRKAERARPLLLAMNLQVFASAHPSPKFALSSDIYGIRLRSNGLQWERFKNPNIIKPSTETARPFPHESHAVP